jgi:hypothetical protein
MDSPGKSGQELGNRAARGVDLHWDRDGVPVVFHQEDDRQLEIARGVERLPELSFTRGSVTRRAEHHFIAMIRLALLPRTFDPAVPQPCFGATDRLQELRSGRTGRAHDVQVLVTPVRRHLPSAGVRVVGRSHCRQQLLGGGHAQAEAERPIAVVGVEPVVRWAENF